jgi:hemerythrin
MDDQHGILMDTMNELRLALVGGCGREQLVELMERLFEFTRMHFRCEERLMEEHGFPALDAHRAEHQRLLAQIRNSAFRAQHSEEVHMRPLLCGLRDGYLKHIGGLDQEYGPWLNQLGVK